MLIIAEKPKMGLAIATALGIARKDKGFIHLKNGDIVTWSVGHILSLCDPDDYLGPRPEGQKSGWREQDLPIIPDEFKMKVSEATKEQFGIVTKLIKQNNTIVNAGDPDREGQLLIDEIFDYIGGTKNKKILRVWLPDLTEKGIIGAFKKLESNDSPKYRGMYNAAKTRSEIDWTMGMNLTRAFTICHGKQGGRGVKSYGRVQTPTLSIVVARDLERENFVTTDYFKPVMHAHHADGLLELSWSKDEAQEKYSQGLNNAGLLTDKNIAGQLALDMKGQTGKVLEIETKKSKKKAPLPFALSDIQKKAAKFGYGVQEVLDTMQSLYEKGFTSYPRTDCNYLPEEEHKHAPAILKCIEKKYPEFKGYDTSLKHIAFNDKKLSAHNAIMPLENDKDISELTDKEETLYKLVCQSFFQLFMPDKEIQTTSIKTEVNGEKWKAQVSIVTKNGWDIYKEEQEESEGKIPQGINKGDIIKCTEIELLTDKTTPPPAFTEGSLAEAMKQIYKHVPKDTDKKYLDILKETQGLGTEATRAGIIETLKKRGFLEVKGKNIVSTQAGRDFISVVPSRLKDPVLTAIWENQLSLIERGEADKNTFLSKTFGLIPDFVEQALNTEFKVITGADSKPDYTKKTAYKKSNSKSSGYKKTYKPR